MELKFVRASVEDIEELYFRLKEAVVTNQPYENDIEPELTCIYSRLKAHISDYTLVKYCGEKAAYFYFHEENGKMRLEDLYVFKHFRGRGIGSSILRRCMSETELPIIAELYNADFLAISLFKHHAFVRTGQLYSRKCIMENKNSDPYIPQLYYKYNT